MASKSIGGAAVTGSNPNEYDTSHGKLGKALLINNVKFQPGTLADRRGAEMDANNIKECFEGLGLDVHQITDVSYAEIVGNFNTIAGMDHGDCDCFVCVIMSHGDVDGIWAQDRKIDVRELMNQLNSDNCISLKGKPKIFFFQCCRGQEKDMGCRVRSERDETVSAETAAVDYSEYTPVPEHLEDSAIIFPADMDFLLVYPSADGKVSYRNTQEGTPFINALCRQLRPLIVSGNEEDIYEILHGINNDIAMNFRAPDGSKQMPCFVSMLRKRFKLRKKP